MTGDQLIEKFTDIRLTRDRVKAERDGLLCERHDNGECVELDNVEMPVFPAPCWKAARKRTEPTPYSDGGMFYLEPPPAQWCPSCQRREVLSESLRLLGRKHGGALRGIIRRGKSLIDARVKE